MPRDRASSLPIGGAATFGGFQPPQTPLPDESFTIAINVAAVGPTTLFTPTADRRWSASTLVLVADPANTITLNSGAAAVTGPMSLAATIPLIVTGDAARNILRAHNVNEVLSITLGAATQVSGWIQLREIGGR